ncbi:MAG: AAA family ATPase [Deltaproteobacteria bacterium]|nr:AAA family ATPase [Deltaproteobacteria bacterium]
MDDIQIRQEKAQNLWNSATRKIPALAKASEVIGAPAIDGAAIGGLVEAQDEVLTYACAMTNPEVYENWGTFPPSGLLLIGQPGSGKTLLAKALATRAQTAFVHLAVPRLALEIVHQGGKVGDLLEAWSQVLSEMPPTTVYFHELEFFQAEEIGGRRNDLPIGPIMDFLGELTDRAVAPEHILLVGSTSHPDTLRPAFVQPSRFERVVEVTPTYPDDIIAALQIHAALAEKRAGKSLFGDIDWSDVVSRFREPSTGDWIHLMHSVLRRKARCEAAAEEVAAVDTEDLVREVDLYRRTRKRLPQRLPAGTYL